MARNLKSAGELFSFDFDFDETVHEHKSKISQKTPQKQGVPFTRSYTMRGSACVSSRQRLIGGLLVSAALTFVVAFAKVVLVFDIKFGCPTTFTLYHVVV